MISDYNMKILEFVHRNDNKNTNYVKSQIFMDLCYRFNLEKISLLLDKFLDKIQSIYEDIVFSIDNNQVVVYIDKYVKYSIIRNIFVRDVIYDDSYFLINYKKFAIFCVYKHINKTNFDYQDEKCGYLQRIDGKYLIYKYNSFVKMRKLFYKKFPRPCKYINAFVDIYINTN